MTKSKTESYHIAQLEKAASIIRQDLDRLSPAEILKLREDLYDFAYGSALGPARQRMTERVALENFRVEEFLKQAMSDRKQIPDSSVREIVDSLKRTLNGIGTTPAGFSIDAEVSDARLMIDASTKSSPFVLSWAIEPKQAARFALLLHLHGCGLTPDRIRLCPLKSCGNVFILKSYAREDREHYCSPKCARNAATKGYRVKKKALELAAKGWSVAAIAAELNMNVETIKRWVKTERKKKKEPTNKRRDR